MTSSLYQTRIWIWYLFDTLNRDKRISRFLNSIENNNTNILDISNEVFFITFSNTIFTHKVQFKDCLYFFLFYLECDKKKRSWNHDRGDPRQNEFIIYIDYIISTL